MPVPEPPVRCAWAGRNPEYVAYHDTEWGRELRGDRALFERLSLEAFQSGLAWITILRKREAFRSAFAGFDVDRVASFGASDVRRLLADPGIVRNRAKIEATIANARAVCALGESLSDLLWSFAPSAPGPAPRTLADVRSTSPESQGMARALKLRGLRFVGPTTAYALMQATGMVNDHLADCWVRTGRGADPRAGRSSRRPAARQGPAQRTTAQRTTAQRTTAQRTTAQRTMAQRTMAQWTMA